jgi:hypothetical protein
MLCVDVVVPPTRCCHGAARRAVRCGLSLTAGLIRAFHHASMRALKSVWVIVAMSSSSASSRPQGRVSFSWAVVYRAEKWACLSCGFDPVYARAVQPHDRDQMRRL